MKKVLTFDDVSLVPKYSDITTREQVDISVDLDAILSLDIPIVGAPMDTVVGAEMAVALGDAGTFGVLHRYNTIPEQADMVTQVTSGTNAESPVAAQQVTSSNEQKNSSAQVQKSCALMLPTAITPTSRGQSVFSEASLAQTYISWQAMSPLPKRSSTYRTGAQTVLE